MRTPPRPLVELSAAQARHRRPADESSLEETYYHRLDPPQGFAFQRVYTDDRSLDESLAVEDHDVVMVPRGYHPVVVPHGYESYYLNVMAGPTPGMAFQQRSRARMDAATRNQAWSHEMIDVALFGAGRIGRIHAGNVVRAARRRARSYVVDVDRAAAAGALAQAHGARSVDAEPALADPDVGAVVIASSTDTHADLILRAAQAGKAIFCEKPVDLDLARARACAEAVRAPA